MIDVAKEIYSDLSLEKEKKMLSYLGLAQKAGKIAAGDTLTLAAVKDGSARLIVRAVDLSDTVIKELELQIAVSKRHIPQIVMADKLTLGIAVGKSQRGLITVKDDGFAKAILKNI